MRRLLGARPVDLLALRLEDLGSDPAEQLAALRDRAAPPAVLLMSDRQDAEARAVFLAAGAIDVVYTGMSDGAFRGLIQVLVDRVREAAKAKLTTVPDDDYALADYATASPAMRGFLKEARSIATKDTTVLLLGETGTGKGLLARSLHNEGPRAGQPFISLNCGALNESVLESELFGHEKGSFTGADRTRRGYFELAHRGTIFLDEIAEMPAPLQVKLLRVLEDREVQPVGSEQLVKVDVRIIAATHRILDHEIAEGRFRSDLYYRLNVVSLTMPALRDRSEDIPELAQSYVTHFSARTAADVTGLTKDAIDALCRYSWPGNVRELINAIERAVIMTDHANIEVDDLPIRIQEFAPLTNESLKCGLLADAEPHWTDRSWAEVRREAIENAELRYLTALLGATGGRVGETARRAGMDPRSLHQKMKKYGLKKESFKD